ncbi:sugar phosphate isomerase/epimerase [Termitidicoccus mucosus]|uniref:Xylose isomerase-like TIM barrel domain-containing protein n=1 Tax=Termitidicoccus mucosus TaxID=1184151 RepID=A0A178ILQ3_9BACT|nr:hypothetical protein AW736_07305 [Opitutaceae bacterium TSB47]
MNIIFSIYPKFFRTLSLPELAGVARDCGLDAVNLVVRDGYWCEPATLGRDTRKFVRFMKAEGLSVLFATAGWSLEDIEKNPGMLDILAENDIREFRLAYFPAASGETLPSLEVARGAMEKIAGHCARRGVRAIYQVHHTMLVSSASAAWQLVRGLPASAVGIELDPGNQSFEGFEDWEKSVSLLGDYLRAFGIKDTMPVRDESLRGTPAKGWSRQWCPASEGVVNWHEVVRPLVRRRWAGTFVFMPFYHEDDMRRQAAVLKQEVAYVRGVVAAETKSDK